MISCQPASAMTIGPSRNAVAGPRVRPNAGRSSGGGWARRLPRGGLLASFPGNTNTVVDGEAIWPGYSSAMAHSPRRSSDTTGAWCHLEQPPRPRSRPTLVSMLPGPASPTPRHRWGKVRWQLLYRTISSLGKLGGRCRPIQSRNGTERPIAALAPATCGRRRSILARGCTALQIRNPRRGAPMVRGHASAKTRRTRHKSSPRGRIDRTDCPTCADSV